MKKHRSLLLIAVPIIIVVSACNSNSSEVVSTPDIHLEIAGGWKVEDAVLAEELELETISMGFLFVPEDSSKGIASYILMGQATPFKDYSFIDDETLLVGAALKIKASMPDKDHLIIINLDTGDESKLERMNNDDYQKILEEIKR